MLLLATLLAVLPSSGSYVVHFSASQALQHAGPSASAVKLTVAGHKFRCRLPELGGNTASRTAYAAQLRSAGLHGKCLQGLSEEGLAFELCIGVHFSVEGRVAEHREQMATAGFEGFEQRYFGSEIHAMLNCTCIRPQVDSEPRSRGPKACDLGQHVWLPTEDGEDLAMVVGALEEAMLLRWPQRGAPRGSFLMPRKLLRSAEDGRNCMEKSSRRPWAFRLHVSKLRAPESSWPPGELFGVQMQATGCCKAEGDEVSAVLKLLEPMEGTCQYVQNGWWTYELCWPWHVRRLHVQTTVEDDEPIFRVIDFGEGKTQRTTVRGATRTEVASVGGVLGFFGSPPQLELRRSLVGKRTRQGQGLAWPQEVVVPLSSGDDCRIAANRWLITVRGFSMDSPVQLQVSGVGGPFNPATLDSVEGYLATAVSNVDGCQAFEERFEGAILLVKRGNCFFQVKASHAEDAGAVALVVYNDNRPPVESMEGVEELVPPRIPSIFVHEGIELLRSLRSRAQIAKVDDEHIQLTEPITGNVVFRCGEDFQRQKSCQIGDMVDVKLWVKSTTNSQGYQRPSSEWATEQELHELAVLQAQVDSSSLRMLRGQVLSAYNETLVVQWLGEGEQDIILGTVPGMQLHLEPPATVPVKAAFRDGVACGAPRDVWIEKLLEPYACNAEFVVHVANLCAVPELSPQRPQEQQDIHCEMESEQTME